MVRCEFAKLEFTENNRVGKFDINTKLFGQSVECAVKAAGNIDNDFFSTKLKFKVQIYKGYIDDIFFVDISQIGKKINNNVNNNLDINNKDLIVNESFEQQVFRYLKQMIATAIVNKSGINANISFTIPYYFNHLVVHIKIGSDDFLSSTENNKNNVDDKQIVDDKKSTSEIIKPQKKSKKQSKLTNSSSSSIYIKSKPKKHIVARMLKLIAWSNVMLFVLYIFNNKRYKNH